MLPIRFVAISQILLLSKPFINWKNRTSPSLSNSLSIFFSLYVCLSLYLSPSFSVSLSRFVNSIRYDESDKPHNEECVNTMTSLGRKFSAPQV